MDSDVLDSRQVSELKVLSPEDIVCFQLAGGTGIKGVIQTQLTEVLLLGRKVFGFNHPQSKGVLYPTAVVLETRAKIE